jgi:hypothetical protein
MKETEVKFESVHHPEPVDTALWEHHIDLICHFLIQDYLESEAPLDSTLDMAAANNKTVLTDEEDRRMKK